MKDLATCSGLSFAARRAVVSHRRPAVLVVLVGLVWAGFAPEGWARSFREGMIPNGQVFSCNTCHQSGGGSPRNPFGLAVGALTGSSAVAFWTAALAAQDSDGDGFTNGEELGDPEGDGTPTVGAQVTNPGNPASFPEVPPIQLTGLELLPDGAMVRLSWTGGRGLFVVEKRSDSLGEQGWVEVESTSEGSMTLELDGAAAFFRVRSEAN